jgi:hypothetical protein
VESVSISCDDCRLQATSACDDCVVSFLCAADPADCEPPGASCFSVPDTEGDAIIIDAAEARAVRMLQQAGLLPRLRFERKVG